jgi:hypothetical protein
LRKEATIVTRIASGARYSNGWFPLAAISTRLKDWPKPGIPLQETVRQGKIKPSSTSRAPARAIHRREELSITASISF